MRSVLPQSRSRFRRSRSGWWRPAMIVALALSVGTAFAGAGRTRPGGGSGGGARPQQAAGRATYGHGGHSGHHGHHGYYGYYGGYYGGYYPYAYGYGYWPWGAWYGGPPYRVVSVGIDPEARGVVETDVKPKRAEVAVDGNIVGQARDYNGSWDRLWLAPGTHVLEFSRDGYMTLRRRIRVRPGGFVRVTERLTKGEGVDPRSSEPPAVEPPAEAPAERVPPVANAPERPGALAHGLLRIDVAPDDAAVYLDGEFLARADELRRLHGALPIARGTHSLEVVRPGYASRRMDVEVPGSEPVRVEIRLERND